MDCFISQEIALFILLVLSGTACCCRILSLLPFFPKYSVKAPHCPPGAISPLKELREGGHR